MKDENEYFNQRIDCDVKSCRFLNREESHCTLGKIKVSGKQSKAQTFCDSFEGEQE